MKNTYLKHLILGDTTRKTRLQEKEICKEASKFKYREERKEADELEGVIEHGALILEDIVQVW